MVNLQKFGGVIIDEYWNGDMVHVSDSLLSTNIEMIWTQEKIHCFHTHSFPASSNTLLSRPIHSLLFQIRYLGLHCFLAPSIHYFLKYTSTSLPHSFPASSNTLLPRSIHSPLPEMHGSSPHSLYNIHSTMHRLNILNMKYLYRRNHIVSLFVTP